MEHPLYKWLVGHFISIYIQHEASDENSDYWCVFLKNIFIYVCLYYIYIFCLYVYFVKISVFIFLFGICYQVRFKNIIIAIKTITKAFSDFYFLFFVN